MGDINQKINDIVTGGAATQATKEANGCIDPVNSCTGVTVERSTT